MLETLSPLRDFGVRSVVTHALMAVTFAAAIVSAVVVGGRVGLISFVAFLNFTAGVWVCQLVHTLGNSYTDDDYDGVLGVLRRRGSHE